MHLIFGKILEIIIIYESHCECGSGWKEVLEFTVHARDKNTNAP